MKQKDKMKIIKRTAFVVKLATAFIAEPLPQIFWQEVIDRATGKMLEKPEGFPEIDEVLEEYSPAIQSAVGDIFSLIDVAAVDFVLKGSAETMARELIQENRTCLMTYPQDEEYQIERAISKYIDALKVWALNHQEVLLQCLERLNSDSKLIKKNIQNVEMILQNAKNQIDQITNEKSHQSTIIDLREYDCYHQSPESFYSYLQSDSDISVENLFLCDNYEVITLNEDCFELRDYIAEKSEASVQFSEILKIVKAQKISLITGMYGTGKTTLMKRLHLELSHDNSENVLFLRAKDLNRIYYKYFSNTTSKADIKRELTKSFGCLKGNSLSYIFIDELEELNLEMNGTNISYLDVFLAWLCEFQRLCNEFVFILGSRKYVRIGKSREVYVADNLFLEYCEAGIGNSLNVVGTNRFSSVSVEKWIDEYAALKEKYINYSLIKEQYKKINEALRTPIFLFAFIQQYLSPSERDDIKGYYFHYSKFIYKTIRGKYGVPHSPAIVKNLPSDEEYREVLQKVAFSILKKSETVIDAQLYAKSIPEEQPLLAEELTNAKYEIQLSELKEELNYTEYMIANVVNCYFFCADNHRVYFTDTNILFALASEYIFETIVKTAGNSHSLFQEEDLKSIEMVHFYPHLVDYIIYLTQNSDMHAELYGYLRSFVTNDCVKSCTVKLFADDPWGIEKILLLYVLFLKVNKESYQDPQLRHIFKEIACYVNIYKTRSYLLDASQFVYSIERYFMGLKLHHLTLKRINLKEFNFKGSKITEKCIFQQCKFFKTNFIGVTMDDVRFVLCDFKDVDEFSIKRMSAGSEKGQVTFDCCNISDCSFTADSITFRNCKIDKFILTLVGDRRVRFEKCFIAKLQIDIYNNLRTRSPEFDRCCFENPPEIPAFTKSEISDILHRGKNMI